MINLFSHLIEFFRLYKKNLAPLTINSGSATEYHCFGHLLFIYYYKYDLYEVPFFLQVKLVHSKLWVSTPYALTSTSRVLKT